MDDKLPDTARASADYRDEAHRRCRRFWDTFMPVMGLLVILVAAAGGQALGDDSIGASAYPLLTARVTANQTHFYVYQDADSGFNHGFPSGFFGTTTKIHLDTACLDDPGSVTGCSTDPDRLDRERGTVLSIAFDPLSPGQFAGVNIEEPEGWGVQRRGVGYNLTGATHVVFEVRSPTPGGVQVQFGVGGSTTAFIPIAQSATYTTMSIALDSLTPPLTHLTDVHLLFAIVTNDVHAPNGGTVLLDNIRFEPIPTRQQTVLGLPLSTQTFGVIPLQTPSLDRVPIPPDQVNRNVATIYEAALTLLALLERGTAEDLALARLIADTFDYALHYDNHGDLLPVAPDGAVGLHNASMAGDIALLNDQGPGAGQAGEVRLAGFRASPALCGPSGFCLMLDGATGGNNAFAILALTTAHRHLQEPRYLDAARTIGTWIAGNLTDTTGTGYGGYYLGYPDGGVPPPKPRLTGKSVENNADIFSAFTALAEIERELGNAAAADTWTQRAKAAGDFVVAMFDPTLGRFYAGTVPVDPPATCDCQQGICPDAFQTRGDDVINTCDFLDANTFTTLALAAVPDYQAQIDWRRPVQFVLDHFAQSITVGGHAFQGFNLVKPSDTVGPNGIAWEFTGQAVVAMRWVDQLYGDTRFDAAATLYLDQLRQAQLLAPFGDGQGLVASTLQDGDLLPPLEQCLSTPFQCIPERVGLAATTWAIFAERQSNPLRQSCRGAGQGLLWGRIQTMGVGGLPGLTLGLRGTTGCNDTATSKVLGLYWFPQLGDGLYTVTPSKAACSFSPPSQEVTLASGRVRANFTATCP